MNKLVPVCTNQQPDQDSPFVADALHQPSRGQCCEAIAAEEGNLDERRPGIRETECFLEMLNKYIVQVDADRP